MSKEEHVAPTGSDGTTTDLAEPDTANASSDDDASSTDTPFGDWREQLRERVKEIRARKHAVHREDVDEIAMKATATAATEDKLDAARAQAAEPQSVDEPSVQLVEGERANRRADIADLVDDLLGGPESPAGTPAADPVEAEEPAVEAVAEEPVVEAVAEEPVMEPVAEEPVVEAVAEEPVMEPEAEEPAVEMEPEEPVGEAPAAPEAAPLFQEEPTVYADDPILEIADEFEHRNENAEAFEASDEAEPEAETEAEPALDAESAGTPDELALPVDNTPLPASSPLDAIPPELRDVDIPAWALPREPSRTPQASADSGAADGAADGADDNFLVGEYTTHEGGKRTDLGPPPDTPIPTADLLDKSIGDLSALSEEALPVEEVEIAPPGSLVDAADFEPGDREAVPEAASPLPGLFDLEDAPSGEETAKPSLFFDEPLAKTSAAEEVPADAGEEVAEEVPEEEPTEVIAAEPSTPVAFFDEPIARADVAETVADSEPTPIVSVDQEVAAEEPLEAAEKAPTPSPMPNKVEAEVDSKVDAKVDAQVDAKVDAKGDSETPDSKAAASGPAESEALEWDIDDEAEAEMVADAQRQFADSSAPMSDRVYSAVADAMVLLTIGLVLMIAGASAAGSPVVPFVRAAPIPFLAAWSLFGLVYGVIFVGTCGQTLGKMAMRVRVIGADTFHVGYGRAALRAIAYAAAALPAGLGLLTAFKDPEHRGLHDRLTGTKVVKA